ncbi:MAG: hypothetical protein CM15mP104_4430 [Gammaproteobacteria bacterium]|nr:MAG: hypothetical protein CM15mP104_4430 [Gammaproteobacteria bacterium]
MEILTKELGQKCQLVGDDLFVTNVNELKEGIQNNAANSILIKFNQVGTIKETFETFLLAKNNNIKTIISHRSGETKIQPYLIFQLVYVLNRLKQVHLHDQIEHQSIIAYYLLNQKIIFRLCKQNF